jgi:Transcriptional Coactivator p15 (PC4)
MTRMNWNAANERARIQRQGTAAAIEPAAVKRPPGRKTTATRAQGPSLAEPVKVDSFWANRSHDACVVMLSTFNGHNIVDVRKHVMNGSGQLVPTPKGIALKVTRLPDLAKAIDKALRKAIDLGLLKAAGEGESE